MRIEEHAIDEGVVWILDGRLTGDAGDVLLRAVSRAANQGCRRIVIDLSGVLLVDAGGLGSLVTAYRASTAHPIGLSLTRVPSRVRKLLTIAQLNRLLPIHDSLEEAWSPRSHDGVRYDGAPWAIQLMAH